MKRIPKNRDEYYTDFNDYFEDFLKRYGDEALDHYEEIKDCYEMGLHPIQVHSDRIIIFSDNK